MKLQDLIDNLFSAQIINPANPEIQQIDFDSRKVKAGSLFVAIVGVKVDGHQFIEQVCEAGASAVVIQKNILSEQQISSIKVPIIVVEDTRRTLDHLAGVFYRYPSDTMFCVGITGTNGKTSLTYLLEHMLRDQDRPTGVIGTVDHHLQIGTKMYRWPSDMTTPDPVFLQKRLREMKDLGAKAIAIEVSSHALDQKRVDSVQFDVAVFTNLTQDHLDYHHTMENYFQAKARLFGELLDFSTKVQKAAVLNGDDPVCKRIAVSTEATAWTYGSGPQTRDDFKYTILNMSATQTIFQLQTPEGVYTVESPLSGEHNVQNAVSALCVMFASGFDLKTAVQSLKSFRGVPGRLQPVPNSKSLAVFVDYAHSPDALENVLKALRNVQKGSGQYESKIWTVFGCGGDRDKGKRPLMAEVAEKFSDHVVVTSDNPRFEKPESIISDIISGFSKTQKIHQEVDRKTAIEWALKNAAENDLILIAGKGHEDYQIIEDKKNHFSDYEVVEKFLKD